MRNYLLSEVRLSRLSSWTGFMAAVLAVVVAAIILVEKLKLALNPDYVTSCSINPIISCGSVIQSVQAAVFWGVPNPVVGLVGFSVVASLFFVSFFVSLPRFVWVLNAVGLFAALAFCFWLAFQALFVIQAICMYCVGIWLLTSVLAWFGVKPLLSGTKADDLQFYVKIAVTGTVFVFVFMIFFAFQTYWMSLFN